jgi:hypothetical protein
MGARWAAGGGGWQRGGLLARWGRDGLLAVVAGWRGGGTRWAARLLLATGWRRARWGAGGWDPARGGLTVGGALEAGAGGGALGDAGGRLGAARGRKRKPVKRDSRRGMGFRYFGLSSTVSSWPTNLI